MRPLRSHSLRTSSSSNFALTNAFFQVLMVSICHCQVTNDFVTAVVAHAVVWQKEVVNAIFLAWFPFRAKSESGGDLLSVGTVANVLRAPN